MARIAKSLETLRAQINAAYPDRDKKDDGWIGDPRHQATASDHNPDGDGIVKALDITHDPKLGPDTYRLAEILRLRRDPRISYVISNGRIFSSSVSPWIWRAYRGSNAHDRHVHISVLKSQADKTQAWDIQAPTSTPKRHERIIATIFGGPGDTGPSAYDGKPIDPTEFGVSLPYRFLSTRPTVRVFRDGRVVDCKVVDIGPWNTNDPYWTEPGRRPQAESGKDKKGRKTNHAGIDLTPAAARAIGVTGLNFVDWEFV